MGLPHLLSLYILIATSSGIARAQIDAPGAKPSDPPRQPAAPTPYVTTVTKDQSTYTITYVESVASAETTVTEQSTTETVKAGEVVGAVLGGAAAGAVAAGLPLLIPKPGPGGGPPVIPEDGPQVGPAAPPPGGNGPQDNKKECQTSEVEICKGKCTKTYFVSEGRIENTSSCEKKDCSKTKGCNISTPSQTAAEPTKHEVMTVASPPAAPHAHKKLPLDQKVLAGPILKIFQEEHIEFPKFSASSKTNDDVKCEEDTAKENIEKKGIKDNIKDFCKNNKDTAASPNHELRVPYEQKGNRGQVNLIIQYTGDRGGGATYTPPNEKTCTDSFEKILSCDGDDQDHTRGGSFPVDKALYKIESYLHGGDARCAPKDQNFGLDTTEAGENIKKFCKDVKGRKIKSDHDEWRRIFPEKGVTTLNTLKIKWTNDSPGCGDGGALFKNGYEVNEDACNRFFTQLLDDCKGDKQQGSVGGSLTDQCAIYDLTVESREKLACATGPGYTDADRASSDTFTRDKALASIDDFCNKDLLADPKAKDPKFSQDGTWPEGVAKGGLDQMEIDVTWPDDKDRDTICGGDTPKNDKFKTGGPECKRKLGDLLVDGCDRGTREKKMGGFLIESGIRGCVQWRLQLKKPMKEKRGRWAWQRL